MQVSRFTALLENPLDIIQDADIAALKQIVETYPYFQAARGMELIGLKNSNSFKYNAALKKHAAYTSDRSWLFEIITQEAFNKSKNTDDAIETPSTDKIENTAIEAVALTEITPATQRDAEAQYTKQTSNEEHNVSEAQEPSLSSLELGKPLEFNKNDRYSFEEWLQLSTKKSIDKKTKKEETNTSEKNKKAAKMAQINAFIATNPKISPPLSSTEKITIKDAEKINKEALMTETLARVYLEQKKYKKALQAYKILSLKYPEKNSFFASQIKVVQKLIKENI
jgi:cell wall-associated NlpC family hydrolase